MSLSPLNWHAHEMIYGYAMAVIAGFLLTAVKNWTGVQTLHGLPLLGLLLLWLAGRVLLFTGSDQLLWLAAITDCLFITGLAIAIARPIIQVRQWKQIGILAKVILLLLSNVVFYFGVLEQQAELIRAGLYSGVYIVMALMFVMLRRVLPFFIEKGVGYPVTLTNRKWVDVASLPLFLVFWIADILDSNSIIVAILSAALFIVHGTRLVGWYTPGLFRKPLLWILYVGYAWLTVGFALKAALPILNISPQLALHAFSYGGIGLFTLGMMARVSLGHTGRSIMDIPPALIWAFYGLMLGSIFRVVFPLIDQSHYVLWIGISQFLWVVAFVIFLMIYLPMLFRPSVDGKPA